MSRSLASPGRAGVGRGTRGLACVVLCGLASALGAAAAQADAAVPTAVIPQEETEGASGSLPVAPPAACAREVDPYPTYIREIHPGQLLADAARRKRLLDNLSDEITTRLVDTGRLSADAWAAALDTHEARVASALDDRGVFAAVHDLLRTAVPDDPWIGLYPTNEFLALPTGSFSGIGVLVAESRDGGTLRVTEVVPFGAAEEAGVRRGDRIVAVDGRLCPRAADIRGRTGTGVELTLIRADGSLDRVRVQRRVLLDASLTLHRSPRDPDVFTLRPFSLLQNDAEAAVRTLRALSERVRIGGLILDLRRVRVGSTSGLALLAGPFAEGRVASYEMFDGTTVEVEASDVGPLREVLRNVPLVVLVDERTEEQAAVLAAALQQRGRALTVGPGVGGRTEARADVLVFAGTRLNLAVSGPARLVDGSPVTADEFAADLFVDADWARYAPIDDPYERTALAYLAR